MALGDERKAAIEAGRELARSGIASSVVVHVAEQGQNRTFVSAVRAIGPADELARRLGAVGTRGVWEAEFRHVRDHGRRWPAETPSQGVGMVFAIWRKADLTHAEFDAYWRDTHAPRGSGFCPVRIAPRGP